MCKCPALFCGWMVHAAAVAAGVDAVADADA